MQHIAKFTLLIAFSCFLSFSAALNTSVNLDPRQMQIQYGVQYTDKECSLGEDRIYGLDNYIIVDPSHIVRGLKGLRPLTIYSDSGCKNNGKYYRKGSCAHYDNAIVSIMCAHMH